MKNVPYIDFAKYLDQSWASSLRSVAPAIIMLTKLSGSVLRLAFSAGFAEMVLVAILSNLLLGFPWLWGFMLGFLVIAASPAVIVPCLFSLQVLSLL